MLTSTKPTTVLVLRHGGSHLILPMVKDMTGSGVFRPKGEDALAATPSGPLIVFTRNPRNWLVSSFRWKNGRAPTDRELAAFMRQSKRGRAPVHYAIDWAKRWVTDPAALIVRFEDLIHPVLGKDVIKLIASKVDRPVEAAAVFEAHVGRGTFTGRHSRWQECFGPEAIAEYRRQGGAQLELIMGYRNG